jgi:hypothetical protein
MRRRRHIIPGILLAATWTAAAPCAAQETARPPEVSAVDSTRRMNAASLLFDRNLNTYTWVGNVALDTTAGGMRFGLLQRYVANIIQLEIPAARSRLQSGQQEISLFVRAPVTEAIAPRVQWSSLNYADNKGTDLNNASTYTLAGGADIALLPWLMVTPLAGYRWDAQAGTRDRGPMISLAASLPGVVSDGYLFSGNGQYRVDRLNPRTLEGHAARLAVQKSFSRETRDSLEVAFTRSRREFYALADSNIESRAENVFMAANRLEYDIDPSVTTTVFFAVNGRVLDKDLRNWGAVGPRDVQFNTQIDEFRFDTYLQASYRGRPGGAGAWIRLFYSERTEAHAAKRPGESSPAIDLLFAERNRQEQVKDNSARRTVLSGALDLPVSASDRIALTGSAGILRYDTPSALNVEDRDELLVALTLATTHRVSPVLDLGVVVEGTIGHTVYLLKERSANNTINRVLRLSPRALFHPVSWITSLNALEVLANYTVYDFERQLASIRSFSYRQFGMVDSTGFDLTHQLGIDVFAYYRVYERGQLNWSDFRERTENSAVEETYAIQARFIPDRGALFAVGIRYFGQSRYVYDGGRRVLDSFLSSIGPTCTIAWEPGRHSRLQFRGWYERRRQPDGSIRPLSTMTLNLTLTL